VSAPSAQALFRHRLAQPALCAALVLLTLGVGGLTGCGPRTALPFTAELDDPDYRRGKELLRMGREGEALAQFLKVIDRRGGAAAESHLEAGILYHKHVQDPIAAIYHYKRYRESKPETEQARLVLQSIEACIRDFARTLPAQPLEHQADRTDMMDAIDKLQRENLALKEQLAGARVAVLEEAARSGVAANGTGVLDFGRPAQPEPIAPEAARVELPPLEPSQGGYARVPGAQARVVEEPEYAAPVAVAPVPTPPPARTTPPPPVAAPTGPAAAAATPTPTPPPAGSFRRHVVARGDTLSSLAYRYYGNRSRWREIYAANRDVMPNEGALQVGMELRIPAPSAAQGGGR
jgi:phage tail protein X